MTVIPAAARGRTFRVPLVFSAVAAIALLAAGCAQQPIRPIPYEQADTASWFSGSADYEMDDSYKADYEEGRAAYDAEDYEDAVNRYGALADRKSTRLNSSH